MRVAFALLLALSVAGCATSSPSKLAETGKFTIGESGDTKLGATVLVVDERPAEWKLRHPVPGGVGLGDDSFDPPPPHAVGQIVSSILSSADLSEETRLKIQASNVSLHLFEVKITSADVSVGAGVGHIPGVAITDYLMRNLAQATLGGSDVKVQIVLGVGEHRYSAEALGRLTASPSSFSIRRLVGQAVRDALAQVQ